MLSHFGEDISNQVPHFTTRVINYYGVEKDNPLSSHQSNSTPITSWNTRVDLQVPHSHSLPSDVDSHNRLVYRVSIAFNLATSNLKQEMEEMEEELKKGLEDLEGMDDNMTLVQYLKDVKLEALE